MRTSPVYISALSGFLGLAASSTAGDWHGLAPISVAPRGEQGTVALSPSTIAILGGIDNVVDPAVTTDRVQYYDLPTNTWSSAPNIPLPLNHLNTAVVDGKIYLLGGLKVLPNGTWSAIPDSWVFDPKQGRWTALAPMPSGTARGSAVTVAYNNTIYLAGGESINVPGAYQNSLDIVTAYDTRQDTWRIFPGRLPGSMNHATGAVVDSVFYVIGGRTGGRTSVKDDVFYLNLECPDEQWKEGPKMPIPRGGLSGAAIGKSIYVFGGEGNPAEGSHGVFNETQVLDTVSMKWATLSSMPVPRHGGQAVAIGDCIYIPGGSTAQGGPPVSVFDKFCPRS